MGGRRSSYPNLGNNFPYTLIWFMIPYSAWLLQDAFAARPSSEHNQGYYVAVLQTGAFSHTAGRSREGVEPVVEERVDPVDPVPREDVENAEERHTTSEEHTPVTAVEDPAVKAMEAGVKAIEDITGGIDTLARLIVTFQAGLPESLTGDESLTGEQRTEHDLGPFPSEEVLASLGLVTAIGEAYKGEGRHEALGDGTSVGVLALLKKLDATDLTKMEGDLKQLKDLEQKEKARKAKTAAIEATKKEMEELNLGLANSRDNAIQKATEMVDSRATAIKGDFAKNQKYHLRELLESVEDIQTKLQAIDDVRHTKKFDKMYDQIDAAHLPSKYAARSGIQGKVPDPMKYQAGDDNHDKIYAPADDDKAPFMRAGEPNRRP